MANADKSRGKMPKLAFEMRAELMAILSDDEPQSLEAVLLNKLRQMESLDPDSLEDTGDIMWRDVLKSSARLVARIRVASALESLLQMHAMGEIGDEEYLEMSVALAQKSRC